ncbi:MAG TPA: hypothetical protein PLQ91_05480 [Bacteroidales bacterium]|jgi:hypothetical protein|nr:hypothetical protein [Bacteroidales bacterium]HOL74348.1 hypothetical protein [Bacteroidales bacterium]HPU47052.1 hypothetical protein [Bacteroidales bacterium]HXK91092.1 hypothetical protein [Bacteroidales bacterium]
MKKIILLLSISLLFLASCKKNVAPIVIKKNVTYQVTTTASKVHLSYYNESGALVESDLMNTTWKYDFKATPNTYLYIGAKNRTESGSITIEILVNDKVKFSNSTVLPYGAINCSGFLD